MSGCRSEADENCVRPGYYATGSGDLLPTFQENLSGPIFESQQVVPQRRYGITTTRCTITRDNAVLKSYPCFSLSFLGSRDERNFWKVNERNLRRIVDTWSSKMFEGIFASPGAYLRNLLRRNWLKYFQWQPSLGVILLMHELTSSRIILTATSCSEHSFEYIYEAHRNS